MGSKALDPDSAKNVVSTISPVVAEFIRLIRQEIPQIGVVYSEELDYVSAMAKFRTDQNMRGTKDDPIPLFAFNRSVLRRTNDRAPGNRANQCKALKVEDGVNSFTYTPMQGEIDINFLYIAKDVHAIEQFEIAYLTEEGISGNKELIIDLPGELGEQKYAINTDEPLEDKRFENQDSFYKTVTGVLTIRGFYYVFKGRSKHILSIQTKIETFLTEVLATNTIT